MTRHGMFLIRQWVSMIFDFVTECCIHFNQNRCLDTAAALTLASLFALVPIFTVLYRILSLVPSFADSSAQIQAWVFESWIPNAELDIQVYLEQFSEKTLNLTGIGSLMLFVVALMMLKRVERAFNLIWRVEEPRRGVISFVRYWAILSLGPFLLLSGLVATSYLLSLELFSNTFQVWGLRRWGLSFLPFLASWAAFSLLNLLVPNCHVSGRAALLGGLFSALGFETAKRGFALFISQFPSYQLVYGALAVLPMFIIWVYLSWVIMLAGAVMARMLNLFRFRGHQAGQGGMAWLQVLHYFWQAQQRGCVVVERYAMRDLLKVLSQDQWERIRRGFLSRGLIQKTHEGHLVLVRDLRQVSLKQFLIDYDWRLGDVWPPEASGDVWQQAVSQCLQAVMSEVDQACALSLDDLFQKGVGRQVIAS